MYKHFPNLEKNIVGFLYTLYGLFRKNIKRASAEETRNISRGGGKKSGKTFMSKRMSQISKVTKLSYENWA